jgi:hypothetical protein
VLTRLEVLGRLTNEAGEPLVVLPWWRDAFDALEDPAIRELILWLPRQAGKSQCVAAMVLSSLLTRPGSYSVLIAAGEAQAQAIFHRKLRRPFERWLRAEKVDKRHMLITKRSIEVLETGAKVEVLATDSGTVPGRAIGEGALLVFDEGRDIPDAVFSALVPSVVSGGKIVLVSTAGAPRGFFFDAVQNPTPETWCYHARENENPYASRPMLEFLTRRLGFLAPAAARRELANEFTDDAESFLPSALIDAAVDDGLGELPSSPLPAFAFLDLARKRDLTSLVVVVRDGNRQPEATDHLVVASIRVWDPRQSATRETDFAEVRSALDGLPARFPRLEALWVDEGAEGGSVLPWATAHPVLTLKVEGFRGSAENNIKLWGALRGRLHAGTLSIPRHERLLAELRGLRQEPFAYGSRWRVVDSSRKYHRDVSLALAGAVCAAGERDPLVAAAATPESVGIAPEAAPRGGFHGRMPVGLARLSRPAPAESEHAASATAPVSGQRMRFWR